MAENISDEQFMNDMSDSLYDDVFVNAIHKALNDCYYGATKEEDLPDLALSLDDYPAGYNKGYATAEIEMKRKYSFQLQEYKLLIKELEDKLWDLRRVQT